MKFAEFAFQTLWNPGAGRTPEMNAFLISKKRFLLHFVILAASGMFMTTAFPGIDFSAAAWCAVIPLIALCARCSAGRAFWYGLIWGWFWNFTACFFLREIMFFIPFIFAVVLGLFTALWASLIPVLFRNLLYPAEIRAAGSAEQAKFLNYPASGELVCVFGLAAWWVVLEWIRSWIFTGFPWNLLGASQWQYNDFIQICEFTGIYGVSFLLILMNLALYFAIWDLGHSIPEGRYKRPWPLLAAAVLCMVNSWIGWKSVEWRRNEFKPANMELITVGAVQPNLSQRRAGGQSLTMEALDRCVALSKELLAKDDLLRAGESRLPDARTAAAGASYQLDAVRSMLPLDLIVWPETAVPVPYYGGGEPADLYRTAVRGMMQQSKVPFLLGTITFENIVSETQYDTMNSALLLKDSGDHSSYRYDFQDSYSKIHLVPYGEFVPWGDKFPWLEKIIGMGRSLTPGKTFRPLPLKPGIRAGVLICYEDVFAYTARAHARNGANLLFVITNDAWYPTSYEPVQHYANSVFRTVETRLPMFRCGNSNYTVLIDARGRTVDSIFKRIDPQSGKNILDPGVQSAGCEKFVIPVPKEHRPTFYTVYGNVFAVFCVGLFLFSCVFAAGKAYSFLRVLRHIEKP